MPVGLNVGNAPAQNTKSIELSRFLGVDLTSASVNVDRRRSPAAPNMMPDDDGYPTKRPGFTTQVTVTGTVHGAYSLLQSGVRKTLLHAGTALYLLAEATDGQTVATQFAGIMMADAPSNALQLKGKLWIVDGQTYRCYDGESVVDVSSIATVPKITIAKAPNGQSGATSYKPVNLLTGKRTEGYLGAASVTEYYLSFGNLTSTAVTARKLTGSGAWETLTESAHFTVDRTVGKVTFTTAPGASPVEGEDNVEITYEVQSQEGTINKMRVAALYGVNGAMDRLFLTGNADEPNVDRWSEWEDPAYFGDTDYGTLGSEATEIVGYSVLGASLITHKAGEENQRNVFVRQGSLDKDGFAVFNITNVVQAQAACTRRGFASANSEPMFLTQRGVFAITASDVTGERMAQNRSYYINTALRKEEGLANTCMVNFGRFIVIAGADRLYLMDSEQKAYEKNEPQSNHQFECYYWTNVCATALWVLDSTLYFGTQDGKVCRFEKGTYLDDGAAVVASWATPLMNLGTWTNKKTVTDVYVVGQPYTRSGGTVYFASDKDFEQQAREFDIDIFDFNDIDFTRFTFNTLDRPVVVNMRKKARKILLFQVKVENDRSAEPFGIYAIAVNYRIGGKAK